MGRLWVTAAILIAISSWGGAGRRVLLGQAPGQAHGDMGDAAAQDGTAQNGGPNEAGPPQQNGAPKNEAAPSDSDKSSFLIARRELDNLLFGKAVVLMLPAMDKNIVVGLIVNRPTKITLHELFPNVAAYKEGTAVAYFGGPVDVETAGILFRSTKAFKQAFHLSGDLYVSFDADLIGKLMKKPQEVSAIRLFLGRSQWGPDQLAGEMERGSWFGEKEENSVIFRADPASVWLELIGPLEPGSVAELEGFFFDDSRIEERRG